jgi:predicted MFS family arabinose efflux permease
MPWAMPTTPASDRPRPLVLAAAALVLLLAFVAIETGSQRPLVPLRIFGNRSLRGANLVTLLNTGAMFPMFFFITLYTQDVLGYSAVQSGLAQLPLGATTDASATLAPRVVVRVGYKATLVAGLAVVAAGLWWLGAVSPDGSFPGDLLGPSLVVGIGRAPSGSPAWWRRPAAPTRPRPAWPRG